MGGAGGSGGVVESRRVATMERGANCCAWNYSGHRMASASIHGVISIYDPEHPASSSSLNSTYQWRAHKDAITKILWLPPKYNDAIACICLDGTVSLWEETEEAGAALEWKLCNIFEDSASQPLDVCFGDCRSGLKLVVAYANGYLRIYQLLDPLGLKKWQLQAEFQNACDPVTRHGNATCSSVVLAWKPGRAGFQESIFSVGFDSDAAKLNSSKVWEFDEVHQRWHLVAELAFPVEQGDPIHAITWAPNIGRPYDIIAVATYKELAIWNVALNPDGHGKLHVEKVALLTGHDGGSGYIGSYLVMKLLQKGYTVNATMSNPDDPVKRGVLKSLPNAESRLHLYKAEIYEDEGGFIEAINGCEFVFHLATPMVHNTTSAKFKSVSEAAVANMMLIVNLCRNSDTVRRLIFTGSVTATSPLEGEGDTFKDFMDETCWTLLNHHKADYGNFIWPYTAGKTLSDQVAMKFGEEQSRVEVVSLACGLVGGPTLLPYLSTSVLCFLSQVMQDSFEYQLLTSMEDFLGSMAVVHIEDVCNAHIFCMEQPSFRGRYICACSTVTNAAIAKYFRENHPDLIIPEGYVKGPLEGIPCRSKLLDLGFKYQYTIKDILEDSLESAKKLQKIGGSTSSDAAIAVS